MLANKISFSQTFCIEFGGDNESVRKHELRSIRLKCKDQTMVTEMMLTQQTPKLQSKPFDWFLYDGKFDV